jgi:outer membrane PBP1 activator LpoA protein
MEWPSSLSGQVVNPYSLPAADYLAKAEQLQGDEKQSLLLLAAGRMLADNQWQQGAAILAQTSHLTAPQQDEKNLLLAKVDLLNEKSEAALAKLYAIKAESFSVYQQIQYHEALAQAYRLNSKLPQSLAERIKLETLLTDEKEVLNNRRTLWLTLINMPQHEVGAMSAEAAEQSDLQGWLQLAAISNQYRTNSKALLTALDEWQTHFSMHPANYILPSPLDSIADKMLVSPKKIALLLPLTGPFSGPGNAVHDGFMAAYNADKGKPDQVEIKLYDTEKDSIARLYEQAVSEGAEYIVGPLTKNQVAAIAQIHHPVPTLLLNDVEKVEANSYSFGLSPSNEATQVAIKASSKGYKRALIFAPNNEWGSDIVKTFSKEWQQQGGRVADILYYNVLPEIKEDFNKKIQDFLHITDSQAREKQIKELLGQSMQILPSRRQDFDMIFLLAYPSKARQIIPALKYYYASDVPVYATSSVYSGTSNPLKDKDLDGVIFCDIPWVFSHQMGTKNWPEQFNSYNRLYALGMDSYALANQLNQLIVFSADGSRKAQGTLYLKPSQHVARILEWGQFKEGLAYSLG